MKVICTGDRDYHGRFHVQEALYELNRAGVTVIVQGGAPGADRLVDEHAGDHGIESITVEAEWTKYPRGAAGPIRNKQMLHEHPDIVAVVFFHDRIFASKGTLDMCVLAAKQGYPVYDSRYLEYANWEGKQ